MTDRKEQLSVPVRGGDLSAAVWQPTPDAETAGTVLCTHGITSSHLAFSWLADELADWRVVAPDLRGRGRSNRLGPPHGMAAHADDLVRLLDHLGLERVPVLGHSMGAFVAVVLAHRHPERVSRLLLVDGGLPIPVPPGLDDDQVLQAVIGPAAERLAMRFASVEEHRDFWRRHPAFAHAWGPRVEAYVDYDLVGAAPDLRPAADYDAVREDSVDIHTGDALRAALGDLAHPTAFVRAERGMLDQPGGLYPEEVVEKTAADLALDSARTVCDVNHYTILMSRRGAAEVAAELTGAPS